MTLLEAIEKVRPGAEWRLSGNSYAGLEWLDKVQAVPTEEELLRAMTDYAYLEKRRREYPSLADQLDAIWKILNGKSDGQSEEVRSLIQTVKAKYPKA